MSQQDAEQIIVPSSSPPPKTKADGPPGTPYGIVALLTVVIGACSWMFKVWDDSEFPETFAHPTYWLLLGIIFLVAGIWAFRVGNRRHWLDFAIVEVLFLASAGAFVESVLVDRQARPSENTFTVVLFIFSDHTAIKDVGNSFRDNIQRELERRFKNEILVLPRDRGIKGEKPEEQVSAARAWGNRRSGCHLAVWAELSTDNDGQNYMVDLHYVRVYPFGTQSNHDEVERSYSNEVNQSFLARPAGGGISVGQDAINEVANRISLLYGLASYEKADYDIALRILSTLGTARSEYFAGRAAYRLAEHSTHARQLFKEAESHYLKAITLDRGENVFNGSSYVALGQTYDAILVFRITDQPKDDSNRATAAYSKASQIFKGEGDLPHYSYSLVGQARALFNLSGVEQSEAATAKDLLDAEGLLYEAFKYIGENSWGYSEAQNILGSIYRVRRDYQKAIHAHETALRFVPTASTEYRSTTLMYLGKAQIEEGSLTDDEALHEEGIGNLLRASQFCQSGAISFVCNDAHMSAGWASLKWADRSRPGSPAWTRVIERAIAEFELSSNFVSKTEHAQLYAKSKEQTALANIERASTEQVDQRLRFLKTALTALTDGIDSLTSAGFDAKQLYEERAQCYDRLRLDSIDQGMKTECLRLARQDREAAKKLARKVTTGSLPR